MLERREAELREAMKLRHSLTTLLHALRVDMERVSTTRETSDLKQAMVIGSENLNELMMPSCHKFR